MTLTRSSLRGNVPFALPSDLETAAIIRLKEGRQEEFRKAIALMRQRSSGARSLEEVLIWGRLATRDATPAADLHELLSLARQADDRFHSPSTLHLLAAVHFRLGRFAESIAAADRSAARHEADALIEDRIFRAMAYQRMGNPVDARAEYGKVIELLGQDSNASWRRQVEMDILKREAEKLILD
ncbi:MAG: hypothetical protein U0744_03790 [Gemmataceae bacterium]